MLNFSSSHPGPDQSGPAIGKKVAPTAGPRFSRTLALLAGALLAVSSSALGAEDWPEFRGPSGQGISTATQVPWQWNATNQVAWKTAIPGRGWSSPVVVKERVYLTTAITEGTTTTLHALCLNGLDGKVLWNVEVFRPEEGDSKAMHGKNSLASPTPIVRGERVFVHFGHLGTAALDLAGQVIWRQTGLKYSPVHGNGGSPALVEDLLIFNCDGAADPFVVALDVGSGEVRWKTPRNTSARNKFSFGTPLLVQVENQAQLISPGSGFVGGYDPKDGRELWRVTYGEGYSIIPRPVYGHGLLFISSGYDRPILHAVKPAGAKSNATETAVAWTQPKGAPNTPSMLLLGDELYFVSDGGIASCVEARTGKVYWTERLGGNFSASPVVAERRLYFINESGVCSVVEQGTTFKLLATNDLGEKALASPAVLDQTLFIRTEQHLWRIGSKLKSPL